MPEFTKLSQKAEHCLALMSAHYRAVRDYNNRWPALQGVYFSGNNEEAKETHDRYELINQSRIRFFDEIQPLLSELILAGAKHAPTKFTAPAQKYLEIDNAHVVEHIYVGASDFVSELIPVFQNLEALESGSTRIVAEANRAEWITVSEAAKISEISIPTVSAAAEKKNFSCHGKGIERRIDPTSFKAWAFDFLDRKKQRTESSSRPVRGTSGKPTTARRIKKCAKCNHYGAGGTDCSNCGGNSWVEESLIP